MDEWNRIYPQGSVNGTLDPETAHKFKAFADGNIAKYRDQWNVLVQCLAGQNVDCVLGQQTVLEILLMEGENYDRPLRLTQATQYYFLLLQKSSVAICAYSRLFLDDDSCKFMPGLKDGLTSVTTSMQRAIMKMNNDDHRKIFKAVTSAMASGWRSQRQQQQRSGTPHTGKSSGAFGCFLSPRCTQ